MGRFLVRFSPQGYERDGFLAEAKSVASSVGVEVKNPKWTSTGHLEVDVFAPSRPDFDLYLATMGPLSDVDYAKDLGEPPRHMEKEQQIAEARALFNDERFWESHEVLEAAWRNLAGQEKLLVQGIILVCAAFVHHQKGEGTVAMGVLQRASRQLEYPAMSYFGINLLDLRATVKQILESGRFRVFKV